jgi:hypothetical protein
MRAAAAAREADPRTQGASLPRPSARRCTARTRWTADPRGGMAGCLEASDPGPPTLD